MTVTLHARDQCFKRVGVRLSPGECQELGIQIIDRRPIARRPDGKAEYRLDLRGGIPVRVVFDGCDIITMWLDRWELGRRACKS